MKKFMMLIIANCFSLLLFGQYDVDIKKDENTVADKKIKQIQEREKLGNCTFIPFHEYKAGMKFYFPKNEYKEKDDFGVMFYYYAKEAKKDDYKRTKILYKDLAGKMFIITKIEERKGIVFPDSYITLKQVDSEMEIEHKMTIGRESLKENWDNEKKQSFNLPYAIFVDDIDSFKKVYIGKELYSKFFIKDIKFQKIKIIQVGAGDEIAPIRVVFETKDGEKEQKDFCTCGTNVSSGYTDLFYFSNFFQFDNPKDNFKGSDEIWNLICQGKIRIGISEEELKLSWGEPKKINKTVVSGIESKQYVYKDQYVYIENGIITSFQSSK